MDIKIINSDVYAGLNYLDDNSIDCAITSPPYWGQRDYGFDGQIGSEPTYNEYIGKLVAIYRLLRNKIKDSGVFFLNIGDKYLSKYGKSPLGMIPFKLAYFMVLDGWTLDDIIIWYKPNHMPSSIKNRFTNSYEPVFVLSKNVNNIFNEYKNTTEKYSNILKINLQQTPYKHTAVYPEQLVYSLLKMVKLPYEATILDPFAGSGTTLKVVLDMNDSLLNKELSSVMIENNEEYINIIKKRCKLTNIKTTKINPIHYEYEITKDVDVKIQPANGKTNKKINKDGIIDVSENKNDYYELLSFFYNKESKQRIDKSATCFVGAKDFDINLIYNTSLIYNYGWIIRNMIVVEDKNNQWFPIFMVVDDNKMVEYKFNYKKLDLKHKNTETFVWNDINFIGYNVTNSLLKNKITGTIIEIIEKRSNGFPKYVIVEWEDKTYTQEFVIFSQEEINENIEIQYDEEKLIFKIEEKHQLVSLNNSINYQKQESIIKNNENKNYNGKFKDEKRKNWGASPGARASLEQGYFSKQRLYEVNQVLVCDYLNFRRANKHLSKKELTELFPKEYKHTVGHWLRKDFGGSLPLPYDWKTLSEILDIEDSLTNYVCKSALKLQIVKSGEYKLPDDFIKIDFVEKLRNIIY